MGPSAINQLDLILIDQIMVFMLAWHIDKIAIEKYIALPAVAVWGNYLERTLQRRSGACTKLILN